MPRSAVCAPGLVRNGPCKKGFFHNSGAGQGGSNVPICFTTDGHMQMHLATQDLGVAQRSGESINPIGVGPIGHIAYRTDDIDAFKAHLDSCGVA